jgi:hypothetical protein
MESSKKFFASDSLKQNLQDISALLTCIWSVFSMSHCLTLILKPNYIKYYIRAYKHNKKYSHAKIILTLTILVIEEMLHNPILNNNTKHTSEQSQQAQCRSMQAETPIQPHKKKRGRINVLTSNSRQKWRSITVIILHAIVTMHYLY